MAEYLRVVEDHPQDWSAANTLGDLYVRSGQTDKAVEQFLRIAASLAADGFVPRAVAVYRKVLKLDSQCEDALLQVAQLSAEQGLLVDARQYLQTAAEQRRARGDARGLAEVTIRLAGLDTADVESRLAGARARLVLQDPEGAIRDMRAVAIDLVTRGHADQAVAVLRDAVQIAPERADLCEALVRACLEAADLSGSVVAARALLGRDPARYSMIGALGLAAAEQTPSAAYGLVLLAADAAEAQGDTDAAISLMADYLTCAPGNEHELARLSALRGPDASHLSAALPEQSEPVAETDGAGEAVEAVAAVEAMDAWDAGYVVADDPVEAPVEAPHDPHDPFRMGPASIDLESILGSFEAPASHAPSPPGTEVDLSLALDGFRPLAAPNVPAPKSPEVAARDLDGVFEQMRREAGLGDDAGSPEREYARAQGLYESGQVEACLAALRSAARSPRLRFKASAWLGRMYRDAGRKAEAVEWFERAAEAPSPTREDGHALLWELADLLEAEGEVARALAICLELRADAGPYRDLTERVDRLARTQTRG